MDETDEEYLSISSKISLATRQRLILAIDEGIVDENSLISFLKNKENRVNKRERKLQKKGGQKDSLENTSLKIKTPPKLISQADSLKVFGETASSKAINFSQPNNPALKDSDFNFVSIFLNGFSIRKMAVKYPELIVMPKNRSKDLLDRYSLPGEYYISFKNPLVNLSVSAEKENWPDGCYRLDINLTVELLLCFLSLGHPIPDIYFKTNYYPNGRELCLKIEGGKIIFRSLDKINGSASGLCLHKDEPWMDNITTL